MADSAYGQIAADGFWKNNVAFVQILGLCPLLAVTSTFVNGLGLGLATTLVLVSSNVTVSLIRHLVRPEVRIPVFVLVIASFVTAVELTMNAWFHDLYKILGIFIPLIVTNCAILGRAEAFASKNAAGPALVDGLTMGFGFTMALVLLGGMREIVGSGTLFAQAHLMFGEGARDLAITVITDYRGFLLAILPPGAFIGLGLLIALKNVVDKKITERSKTAPAPVEPAAEPTA
ncbi:electron transport complex subunit E [Thiohalomonas denitrificans]|uniref:electron transport complex subunit E n=1 Tax=Thiohalomonas denitrificans TaxID=415747 RepID=UPI0026EE7A16|nr:electron transport complex subunit E [Thiohalomonas denitrificans]